MERNQKGAKVNKRLKAGCWPMNQHHQVSKLTTFGQTCISGLAEDWKMKRPVICTMAADLIAITAEGISNPMRGF